MEEDVRPGDLVRWNTVNGSRWGEVKQDEEGGLCVVVDDTHRFRLEDLCGEVVVKHVKTI